MIRITFTFPPATHVRDGLDLATDDFLVDKTITFRGEVTWTAGTAVGLDGFPFQGLLVTAHESRYYDGVDSDWVEVRDEPVPRVTLADPTGAAFDHDLTPLDAMARYKVKVLALSKDGEVLAASVIVRDSANLESGFQLTLPQKPLELLAETIRTYDGNTQSHPNPVALAELKPNVVFTPLIKVAARAEQLRAAVLDLKICPPDMRVASMVLDPAGHGVLIVAGPAGRQGDYTTDILPILQQHAAELS